MDISRGFLPYSVCLLLGSTPGLAKPLIKYALLRDPAWAYYIGKIYIIHPVKLDSSLFPSVAIASDEDSGNTPQGKKLAYVEPSRRVKEILEEELCFWKEACQVKHPAAVALEGIWSAKKNFSLRNLKPVSQNKNSLLLQPQFYSRHGGMKNC
ncbi:hypothetical protein AV530_010123 [Patagioenas fasciata monilis]|uniref:Uncharacterized protein n=1 Tax=Patagioenas fasciata monilis TaxID=372326 RepID=A0A1V4L106_PATFA|nr:hypothetical protein AV530_010123 [Patagioenas fasciata monilis]